MFRSYTVPMTAQKPVGEKRQLATLDHVQLFRAQRCTIGIYAEESELPILSRSAASATEGFRWSPTPNSGRQRIFRLKIAITSTSEAPTSGKDKKDPLHLVTKYLLFAQQRAEACGRDQRPTKSLDPSLKS